MGGQPVGAALAYDSFTPAVAVAPDSTVYIGWIAGTAIKFVKSTDGGNTFTPPAVAASGITPLQSPPLPGAGGFPELPGGLFRVLTLPAGCAGDSIVFAWADYREGVSRIYYCYSHDGGGSWLSPAAGQALLIRGLASAADQHDFHPQLACLPDGRIGCAFYEFGPKWPGGPHLIDVVLAVSNDGATFDQRETVTTRAWDPALDAPLSHGLASVTFIGDYFGLAANRNGFYLLWTDTRTGMQEIFFGGALNPGPWSGLQFRNALTPRQEVRFFIWGWPACWQVAWLVLPTSPAPGAPEIAVRVEVERASTYYVTYWIIVINLTDMPINVEGRYEILAAC